MNDTSTTMVQPTAMDEDTSHLFYVVALVAAHDCFYTDTGIPGEYSRLTYLEVIGHVNRGDYDCLWVRVAVGSLEEYIPLRAFAAVVPVSRVPAYEDKAADGSLLTVFDKVFAPRG